jgi:hypothetical protein
MPPDSVSRRYPPCRAAHYCAVLKAILLMRGGMSRMGSLSVPEFVAKWQSVTLAERSVAQQYFLELRRVRSAHAGGSIRSLVTRFSYRTSVCAAM